jgi:hypothetical protein
MNTEERLPLPALGLALADRFGRGARYRTMLTAAIECRIPAERSATGRWSVAEADIDLIGRYFKLDTKEN